MAILLPEIHSYLYSFTTELNIDPVAHRDVLCVKYNQRLLLHLNGHVPRSEVINQIENIAGLIGLIIFNLLLCWTAFQTLKAVSLNETPDNVFHFGWACLLAVTSVFFALKITSQR